MISFFKNKLFLFILRIVIGAVFLYAGILKMLHPLEFADSIATFDLLPSELINLVALALPPFEILLGGLLLPGGYRRQVAFSLWVLTVLFALFLIQAIVRGLEVDCGCFGSGEASAGSAWVSLARDFALMLGTGWLWWCGQEEVSRKAREDREEEECLTRRYKEHEGIF